MKGRWAGLGLLLAGGLFLLIWGGTSIGKNLVTSGDRQQVEKVNHFWRVVAGADMSSGIGVDRLAQDLNSILEPEVPGELPVAVSNFRGDPNLYGGVTASLGFDPFDKQDEQYLRCHDCGKLSQETLGKLRMIKNGQLAQVLQASPHGKALAIFVYAILVAVALLVIIGIVRFKEG